MLLNGLKFVIVNHYFARFCDHSSCGSSDTAGKIVNMTLQDHMIKGFGDFMERKLSLNFPTLPKVIAIDIVLIDL